jgi:hypothetical protein
MIVDNVADDETDWGFSFQFHQTCLIRVAEAFWLWVLAGHTGQSSQLFPVTNDRNAQFLATVAEASPCCTFAIMTVTQLPVGHGSRSTPNAPPS